VVYDVVGYIVNHYCLGFLREVVGYIVDHYSLAFVREVVYDVVPSSNGLQCNQPHHEPLL
jgi:hypothetical protein